MPKSTAWLLIFAVGCVAGGYAYERWLHRQPSLPVGSLAIDQTEAIPPPPPAVPLREPTIPEILRDLLRKKDYQAAAQLYAKHQIEKDESLIRKLRDEFIEQTGVLRSNDEITEAAAVINTYLENEYRDIPALELLSELQLAQEQYLEGIRTLYKTRGHAYRIDDLARVNARIRATVSIYTSVLEKQDDAGTIYELYQEIVQLEPDYPPYYIALAKAQIALGAYDGAAQSLSLIRHDPLVADQVTQLLDSMYEESPQIQHTVAAIPLIPMGDQFLVNAWVNDRLSVLLLVDTGASLTTIKPSSLESAGIAYVTTKQQQEFHTANGTITAPILTIDALTVGDQRIGPVRVGGLESIALPGIDGLLGMNFLKHYEFYIDQTGKFLHLSSNTQTP